jgi:hypothetical protein
LPTHRVSMTFLVVSFFEWESPYRPAGQPLLDRVALHVHTYLGDGSSVVQDHPCRAIGRSRDTL